MKRPRVFYVGSPELFSKGASSIHIMKMCQAMSRLGFQIELVFPSYKSGRDIFDYYGVTERFRITSIPCTNLINRQIVHGVASAVYCGMNKAKFDLVITRNIVFTYIATRLLGIPTIYDAHHPLVNGMAKAMFKKFKDSRSLVKFVTNSRGLADIYVQEGLNREKLIVSHNGVDIERFKIDGAPLPLRKELGLPTDVKIVCYCGNTYSGRGIEMLIDAAQRFKDIFFLVVGGLEADNDRYVAISKEKGVKNFFIKGFVPHTEVPKYLKASDVLAIPYSSDVTIKGGTKAAEFTSPIKLFEYMAAGKPIISSKLPTITEVLEDGRTASFFEAGNLDSFCKKLDLVLNDPDYLKKLSENALSEVLSYTWEARVKRIFELN